MAESKAVSSLRNCSDPEFWRPAKFAAPVASCLHTGQLEELERFGDTGQTLSFAPAQA